MKLKNIEKLKADFPTLYKQIKEIDVPDAWFKVIYDLSVKLMHILAEKDKEDKLDVGLFYATEITKNPKTGALSFSMKNCFAEQLVAIFEAQDLLIKMEKVNAMDKL